MILELYPPPSNEPVVVSDAPTDGLIIQTIQSQPWSDITFVVLKRDDANWFEISGSLADGLSARFAKNGDEKISEVAPSSLSDATKLMLSYFREDGHWRSLIPWSQ